MACANACRDYIPGATTSRRSPGHARLFNRPRERKREALGRMPSGLHGASLGNPSPAIQVHRAPIAQRQSAVSVSTKIVGVAECSRDYIPHKAVVGGSSPPGRNRWRRGECCQDYIGGAPASHRGSRVRSPGGLGSAVLAPSSPRGLRGSYGANAAGTTCRGFESRRLHSSRGRSSVGRAEFRQHSSRR